MRSQFLTSCAIATLCLSHPLLAQTVRNTDEGVKVVLAEKPRLEKFVEPLLPLGMVEEPGSVEALLILRADGWVADVRMVKVDRPKLKFWMSAEAALRQWHYDPASLAGLPAPVRTHVTVNFPRRPPHDAGKLIADTDLYRVTATGQRAKWCGESNAMINITWRVSADEDLSGNSAGYQKHLAEIWEAVEKQCKSLGALYVANFVSGVRLVASDGTEVAETAVMSNGTEVPVNQLLTSRDASGKFTIRAMDVMPVASLAAARAQRRTGNPIALPPARSMSAGTSDGGSARPAPAVAAASAPTGPATRPVATALAPPPASVLPPLDIRQLRFGDMMRTIYLGRFDLVPMTDPRELARITPEGAIGRRLFTSYVEAFSSRCPGSLPPDKQRMKVTTTTTEQRRNMRGIVTTERLVGTETNDTDIYADPKFAGSYVELVNAAPRESLATIFRDLAAGRADSFGGAGLNQLDATLVMWAEMRELLSRHGCESPQVKRFASNVLRYVQAQPPELKYRFDGFAHYCAAQLPKYVPGTTRAACPCVRDSLHAALPVDAFYRLEDDFTEEHFMKSVVAQVGLTKKVGACIH